MKRLTVAVAALLLGTLACSAYPNIGEVTTGGDSGASASGGGGTSSGTSSGSATGGSASGVGTVSGSATGGTTTGQTIGDPAIAASDAAMDPNPCEVDFDFGSLGVGLTTSESFTISNAGNGVLDLLAVDGGTVDPAFGASYTTPPPIQPDGQFQFTVSFSPSVQGQVTSTVTIPTDGLNPSCPATPGTSDSSLTVQLTGTGIPFCLQVQPTLLDFGNTEINTSNTKSVTLTNACTAPATGIAAAIRGGDSNLFTVVNAPSSIAAGDQATVDITYAPLALETRSLANVTFSDADSEPATLNLFGEPVAVALTVAPNPCDFGMILLGDEAQCCTTVTAQANVSVTISDVVDMNGISELNTDIIWNAVGFQWYNWRQTGNPLHLENVPIILDPGGSVEACFAFYPLSTNLVTEQATLETNDPSGNNPVILFTGEGSDAGPG